MLDFTSDISRSQRGTQISAMLSDISARDQQRNSERETFASTFNRAKREGPMTPQREARDAAEGLVSMALLQPVLKQMREANNAQAPFGPGQGEKTMRAMLDQAWADNIVKTGNWSLVDRIEERMLERLGKGKPKAQGPLATSLETTPAAAVTTLQSESVVQTDISRRGEKTVTTLDAIAPARATSLR